jgi:hypothetical protein
VLTKTAQKNVVDGCMMFRSPGLEIRISALLSGLLLLLLSGTLMAQTTVMISSVVQQANLDRPGINVGGMAPYGTQQMLRDFGMEVDGYFQPTYWQTSFVCTTGGVNDTTHWFNNLAGEGGYPTNFWEGATYTAVRASTGTSFGSGRITASTANISAGTQFTLGTPLSSPCTTNKSAPDMLIVRLRHPSIQLTPRQALGSICPAATFNTTDTSPASANTYQSLEMPSHCTLQLYMDQVLQNATNPRPDVADRWQNWININGSYRATFKAKCLTPCSLTYSVTRGNGPTYIPPVTVSPAFDPAPGLGWTTYSRDFTASETGRSGYGALQMTLAVNSGTALVQDSTVIEGSTLPGNTTLYRDAWVRKLQSLHPGSLRFMDASDWCSTVTDLTEAAGPGAERSCGYNIYSEASYTQGVPYRDRLQLCLVVGADCWITVGQMNQAEDWTALIEWLADPSAGPSSGTSWIQAFAAAGFRIYLEDGNEVWNTSAGPGLWAGNGPIYGHFLGSAMAAAKAASGYNSSVIRLVADSWAAPAQGYGPYGWVHNMLTSAGCSRANRMHCPDFVSTAPYLFSYLADFDVAGANVATTGAPFADMWAEAANVDSLPNLPDKEQSMARNVAWVKDNFDLPTAVYEVNGGLTRGSAAPTQLQLDQIAASAGEALSTVEHLLLLQRDAGVAGPMNVFLLAQNSYYWNFGKTLAAPLWGITRTLACGPGQLASCSDVDRPLSIALQVVNRALGQNDNLMRVLQVGTPTFSYPGGQEESGWGQTILANPAVRLVQAFVYANAAKTRWTAVVFNNNLSHSEPVELAGAGAPRSAAVMETLFGDTNRITDHNENTSIGPRSDPPVVTMPRAFKTSGNHYRVPPATMMVLTWTTGGHRDPPR